MSFVNAGGALQSPFCAIFNELSQTFLQLEVDRNLFFAATKLYVTPKI